MRTLDNVLRHEYGYRTTSMDFRYTPAMDFNEDGGFAFLGVTCNPSKNHSLPQFCHLRLCLYNLLNCVPCEALTLFAPDCSSWGMPCRHTSGRSLINPHGHITYQFVASANRMVSRFFS